ncbi:MAG: lamin tail domain-containing protein [Deltaproteobacteria bacterium]|nr:lamin tail domain-containing protein [Deltaproteobacteria bacterium]
MKPRFLVLGLLAVGAAFGACARANDADSSNLGNGGAGNATSASSSSSSGSGAATSSGGGETAGGGGATSSGVGGAGGAAGGAGAAGGGGDTCAHDVCEPGEKLDPACSDCVGQLCAEDDFCCQEEWDEKCVSEAQEICGVDCGGGGGGGAGGGGSGCTHDVCDPGPALAPGCNSCTSAVCAEDPYCCQKEWDSMCIDEVLQYCGKDCGGGGGGGAGGSGGAGGGGGNGPIAPGDLVITEIMNNPKVVTDDVGEWFEVYNDSAQPIDMKGLLIRHQLNDPNVLYTVKSSVLVPPGGYVVLGKNGDPNANGGVKIDYVFGSAIALSNTADVLGILVPGNPPTLIDETKWDAKSGLNPNGASRSLDPKFLSASQNNDDTHFCEAKSFIKGNAGDKGTPGKANDPCG